MKLIVCALAVCLTFLPALAAGSPTLTVTETSGGPWVFTGIGDVPGALTVSPGTPIVFSWSAVPGGGTVITDYRYGWDLVDPDDPNDSWSEWGSGQSAPSHSFSAGLHTFTVEARNDLGETARGTIQITIEIPLKTEVSTWGAIKAFYR
jgi:hypothetical protein